MEKSNSKIQKFEISRKSTDQKSIKQKSKYWTTYKYRNIKNRDVQKIKNDNI